MAAHLSHLGQSKSPLIIIDDASKRLEEWRQLAQAMAPFPQAHLKAYPGLRRIFTNSDEQAMAMVDELVISAAPLIGRAFKINQLALHQASFSMVTTPAKWLTKWQCVPHFDHVAPNRLALLLYLSDTPNSGTGFYRHQATEIEEMTEGTLSEFSQIAHKELEALPEAYINQSNAFYEQIGRADAKPDRMIIYRGNLLHSGIIPEDMCFSEDPRQGRLTLNLVLEV